MAKQDPTLPVGWLTEPSWRHTRLTVSQAKMHGNEPSKGAKVDAELAREEEQELRRKGKA
jgi:hypothetical protein